MKRTLKTKETFPTIQILKSPEAVWKQKSQPPPFLTSFSFWLLTIQAISWLVQVCHRSYCWTQTVPHAEPRTHARTHSLIHGTVCGAEWDIFTWCNLHFAGRISPVSQSVSSVSQPHGRAAPWRHYCFPPNSSWRLTSRGRRVTWFVKHTRP